MIEDRNLRQQEIIPPDRLAACSATVVGVGAIGRQVALQLAAIGIPKLQLLDHDDVEAVNICSQGYWEKDMGRPKVVATAEICQQICGDMSIDAMAQKFKRSQEIGNVLFSCVDGIETRAHIWEAVKDRVDIFIDGRMSAEIIRIIAASDERSREHYPKTLFPAAEAYQGSCTARSTIFTANIAAGLMIEQFTRWLRDMPIDQDMSLNLLSGEMDPVTV